MHPTPLRIDKIVRISKAGISSTAFPIYWCGAGDGQAVGRQIQRPSSDPAVTKHNHQNRSFL
jgi:hypothetical protein